jgi:predicted SAM-dependent methyltransferase
LIVSLPRKTILRWLIHLKLSQRMGNRSLKKLNLRCGDKILPGYVNVDVAASRRGLKPDVLCDLHKLTSFEDNTVDGILSVHVVEHFWRWEVARLGGG